MCIIFQAYLCFLFILTFDLLWQEERKQAEADFQACTLPSVATSCLCATKLEDDVIEGDVRAVFLEEKPHHYWTMPMPYTLFCFLFFSFSFSFKDISSADTYRNLKANMRVRIT